VSAALRGRAPRFVGALLEPAASSCARPHRVSISCPRLPDRFVLRVRVRAARQWVVFASLPVLVSWGLLSNSSGVDFATAGGLLTYAMLMVLLFWGPLRLLCPNVMVRTEARGREQAGEEE
jgi:hypothetical protein